MEKVILVVKLVAFFISFPLIQNSLQSLNVEKLFRSNSTWQIRFLVSALTIILGWAFAEVFAGIFDAIYQIIE